MATNLLSLAQQTLGGDFPQRAGQLLGEPPEATRSALSSLLPAVLGGVARQGATPDGAAGLMSLINGANLNVGALSNLGGLFGDGAAIGKLEQTGSSSLVPALFGGQSGALANALSSTSGIKSSSASRLLAMVVPLILTFLKKFIGDNRLDARGLSSLLGSQGAALQTALDGRLASALGFASPAAMLGGQAAAAATQGGAALSSGAAAVAARGGSAADTVAAAGKSGLMRWLPWLFGAFVLLFLWSMFGSKPTPTTSPASTPSAVTAPAPAPSAAAAALPARVYFAVGSAAVDTDASRTITALAETIAKNQLKVGITGYTDQTGDIAQNEALAKSRAVAVRDALKAAGAPEANLEMKPPAFVEKGAGGSDAEARRVEINPQ